MNNRYSPSASIVKEVSVQVFKVPCHQVVKS